MASVQFLQVSAGAFLGGAVEGVVRAEFDKPTKVRDITLTLTGSEHSQTTVQAGKNSETITQVAPFLQQAVSLRERIPFQDPEHATPGTYDLPFKFPLPVVAPPTLATSIEDQDFGHIDHVRDGMYVDYALEIKVDVPLWIDPLRRHRFPVYPPVRVLGGMPEARTSSGPDRAGLQVAPLDGNAPWIFPGKPCTILYNVQNPSGKTLKGLTARLVRDVSYVCRGRSCASQQIFGNFFAPFQGNAPSFQGRLDLMVPNDAGMVNPGSGQLFRCTWSMEFDLGVEWGFDAKVKVPLTPPVVQVPVPTASPPPPYA
ncbi:MAG: hypothetical protein KGI89_03670 [Euryarchaeota archaeon]|nr:hypothetical protein [Euryarchaeota archaeon]